MTTLPLSGVLHTRNTLSFTWYMTKSNKNFKKTVHTKFSIFVIFDWGHVNDKKGWQYMNCHLLHWPPPSLMCTCREPLLLSLASSTASCMLAAILNYVRLVSAKLGIFAVTASCAALLSKPLLFSFPSPYSPLIVASYSILLFAVAIAMLFPMVLSYCCCCCRHYHIAACCTAVSWLRRSVANTTAIATCCCCCDC